MGKGGSERSRRDCDVRRRVGEYRRRRWPEHGQAFVAVRRMQTKLHCWAAGDRGRRFDDLYNLVCDPTLLVVAWQRVAGNAGARTAGIDRATVAWIVVPVRGRGVPAGRP